MPNLMMDEWAYASSKRQIQRLQDQVDDAKERYARDHPNQAETTLMDAGYRLPITVDAEVLLQILHEKLNLQMRLDYVMKVHAESAGWNNTFPRQTLQYPPTPDERMEEAK